MQAIQNPHVCFTDSTLRQGKPALDRLGMPVVMSGNFAYVFKLHIGTGARAIKCFRQFLGDREARYVEIDKHLDANRIPALAEFEYDADGIAVNGRRYPILIMEWVDGNTLDVYVGTLIKQQKAKGHLKPLAEQWSELVCKLELANIAHGDLQHGNVIVTPSGSLKLVDLDGMYVPALNGRQTTELGHIHFQHPNRAQAPFDARLDHFSSLVIYTSLLALDHDPSLWDQFHDDNLVLAKGDFADPSHSKLIRLMKQQGGEVARLTDVLATACSLRSPATVPSLSSLVQIKHSKLPDWMRPSTVVTVQTKTREASPVVPVPLAPTSSQPVRNTATPGSWKGATASVPATVSVPARTAASQEWFGAGLKRGLRLAVSAWFLGLIGSPFLLAIAQSMGAAPSDSWFVAILLYVGGFLCVGVVLEARGTKSGAQTLAKVAPVPVPAGVPVTTRTVSIPVPTPVSVRSVPVWQQRTSTRRQAPASGVPVSTNLANQVVGSKIRLVYHRPGCDWTSKISSRNRISFASPQMAAGRGYRPCRVCNP
jgi:hypothetical protein